MTERYSWKDVRGAAMRFERAIRAHIDIPDDAGLSVEPGSVTNGICATIHWRQLGGERNASVLDLPIPGGQHLSRRARQSFDMLADRARVLEDVSYETKERR